MQTITVQTNRREELVNVTRQIQAVLDESGVKSGLVVCYVPHTTAAVTINESADPDVARDIIHKLNKEIPQSDGYHHGEGNSDAHVKSSLVGASTQVILADGKLVLGTWQGIFFCEFDGPRQRRMHIEVLSRASD